MVVFKKTNVGTAIMVIAKSEGVVFNSEPMFDGKPQSVCQAEQDVAELPVFVANKYFFMQLRVLSRLQRA